MKIPGYAFWETFRKFQVAFCDDLQPVSLKFDLLFMRDIASKNIYVDLYIQLSDFKIFAGIAR